jgi:phenylacetate-coenzyme A ligase PaaK-like adenylate-forming protein
VAPILVTKLHADAMPLIRYAVEDVAEFPDGSRPGAPVFHLRSVVGRSTDRIVLPGGRWVHGIEFPHLMKDFPVRDFQVVQASDLAIEVRLVPDAAFTPAHRAALQHTLGANLPGVPLTVREVPDIPRTAANKWRPVISEA